MKIKLHHLNLCSKDVAGMEALYRSVLDLEPESSLNSARDTTQGYAAPVAFVTDGQTQVHQGPWRRLPHQPHCQSARARPHRLPHRRHRRLQATARGEEHPLFRLWPVGDERLASDLLL
ncbi:MAG TPA: hypothetical protein VKI44_39700 [Acetobacteraceae bacterium]|nr:hypothetical protein [Acetobacteraceae bacterium]